MYILTHVLESGASSHVNTARFVRTARVACTHHCFFMCKNKYMWSSLLDRNFRPSLVVHPLFTPQNKNSLKWKNIIKVWGCSYAEISLQESDTCPRLLFVNLSETEEAS